MLFARLQYCDDAFQSAVKLYDDVEIQQNGKWQQGTVMGVTDDQIKVVLSATKRTVMCKLSDARPCMKWDFNKNPPRWMNGSLDEFISQLKDDAEALKEEMWSCIFGAYYNPFCMTPVSRAHLPSYGH